METTLLYGGDVELLFDQEKHVYTVSGETIPGVTSVLEVIAKPKLIAWAAGETAKYVYETLKNERTIDPTKLEAICEQAKRAHRQKKEKAGDVGHLVHAKIENYIKTGDATMPENEEAKRGFAAFLRWAEEHKVEFTGSEFKVCSKKHKFAGTVDFTAVVNGKKVLGDIKTSSGIYDEYFFQTAAYELAIREEKKEKFKEHLIVNCRKDGTLEVRSSKEFTRNSKAFLAALTIYRRQRELKNK